MSDEVKIGNGGPAFPGHFYHLNDQGIEQVGNHTSRVPGMSLRDWFAGMALMGGIAGPVDDVTHDEAADEAYLYADAMLRRSMKFGAKPSGR